MQFVLSMQIILSQLLNMQFAFKIRKCNVFATQSKPGLWQVARTSVGSGKLTAEV